MNKDTFDIKKFLEKKDHSGVDLRGVKLTSLDLQDHSFESCDLTGANFLGSNLAGADFSSAKLDEAVFTGANLYGAIWEGSHRSGQQVEKFASIVSKGGCFYGFKVTNGKKKATLVNQNNAAEYEFKQSIVACPEVALLVNVLNA